MYRRLTPRIATTADLLDGRGAPVEGLPRFRADQSEGLAAAMFLGPRAEHTKLLRELVVAAVDDVAAHRQSYLPGDPDAITKEIKSTPEYLASVARLRREFDDLLGLLKHHATPYFSMRYQGHMLHDTLLPGIVGYFATMLHNPNNVTVQASTVTTFLELLVGWDLCTMLGFPFDGDLPDRLAEPWGHITADGTVANLEALWANRELRLFPVAVRAFVDNAVQTCTNPRTSSGADPFTRTVARFADEFSLYTTIRGTQRLRAMSTWDLCNVAMDDALGLPDAMAQVMGLDEAGREAVWQGALSFAPNSVGLFGFYKANMGAVPNPPVLLTPSTKHYSWPKAASVLGLGDGPHCVLDIAVDLDARVDIDDLRLRLDKLVATRTPVALVVAIAGTTEEAAVDDIGRVLEVREEFRAKGLEFNVHTDAAWGGYFATTIRKDFRDPGEGTDDPFLANQSKVHLNTHTKAALARIRDTDSATIDPHKMGYVQYPAGALCYRDGRQRNLITYGAYVIGTPGSQVSVGEFGIEGSKPGAAPAAVYLSHAVLRPSTSGYGQLLNEVQRSAKAFYLRIATLAQPTDPFICVPLARFPSERDHLGIDAEWLQILPRLASMPIDEILADPRLLSMFNELGPDQNIVDYVFNLRLPDGSLNTDYELCTQLNDAVYAAFHVHEGHFIGTSPEVDYGADIRKYPLLISQTQMNAAGYGTGFIDDLARRIGISLPPPAPGAPPVNLHVNRTVVMDPWLGVVSEDGELFLDTTMQILRAEVSRAAHKLLRHR